MNGNEFSVRECMSEAFPVGKQYSLFIIVKRVIGTHKQVSKHIFPLWKYT
jgi:hypothetical protein